MCIVQVQHRGNSWLVGHDLYATRFDITHLLPHWDTPTQAAAPLSRIAGEGLGAGVPLSSVGFLGSSGRSVKRF